MIKLTSLKKCLILLLSTLVNFSLLKGVYDELPRWMLPWLVFQAVALFVLFVKEGVGAVVAISVMSDSAFVARNSGFVGVLALTVVAGLVGLGLGCYFWYCVYYHYKVLKAKERARNQETE